jgi:hypothetical protein
VESGTDFSICLAAGDLGKAEKGMGGDWRLETWTGERVKKKRTVVYLFFISAEIMKSE